ncbi:MAG: hypothetical protein LKJ44_06295 [Bifidobacteriaceae bacterium]|nr:hypothetical protein [Bifidobacteriaceae bacterium]MCI1979302.1 hypothetical protein [Bifidobacteriaceae bacterium]
MTDKAQSRLYAVTSIACIVWLITSSVDASKTGTMFSIWNLFFSLCLLVVIGWTGWQAITMMVKTDKEEEDDVEDLEEEANDIEHDVETKIAAADDTTKNNQQ